MAGPIIAGISPGGLKETYEVKILVCYLLNALDAPLSRENITELCTGGGLTDYFTLSTALSELEAGDQLREEAGRLTLTPRGRETAENLKQALPSSLRGNIVRQGMELLARLRRQNEVSTKILPDGKGFRVACAVHEGTLDFFTMTFYAPDREQAEIIARSFSRKSTEIYQDLIRTLTDPS